MGISINRLARDIAIPPGRISAIVNGKRSISADTALRLRKYFAVSSELWIGLQADYDLRSAKRTVGPEIEKRVHRYVVRGLTVLFSFGASFLCRMLVLLVPVLCPGTSWPAGSACRLEHRLHRNNFSLHCTSGCLQPDSMKSSENSSRERSNASKDSSMRESSHLSFVDLTRRADPTCL
jgi:antitoxin HigA-1